MSHKITIHPDNLEFSCEEGETILDAAEKAGLVAPVSCRNGVCWICEAKLLAGEVKDSSHSKPPVVGSEVRLCRAYAQSDLLIETETIHPEEQRPQRTLACQIRDISAFNGHVYRVTLATPAGTLADFHAGQYLCLNIPDMDSAYFSIASKPGQREIELHIEAPEGKTAAQKILRYLKLNPVVSLTLPFGLACLPQSRLHELENKHVLLVSAGTGYAQVRSIASTLFNADLSLKQVDLFWGGRTKDDLYDLAEPQQWQKEKSTFHFHPLYSDREDNEWQGHHDQLGKSILSSELIRDSLKRNELWVYASGSPAMVYGILDLLCEEGMSASHFFSDVLEYAPRG